MKTNGLRNKKKAMARAAFRASALWDRPRYLLSYRELNKACIRVDRWSRAAKGRK